MSHDQELANEIAKVMRQVPTLEFVSTFFRGGRFQWDFTISSWDALLVIAHAGYAANVRGGKYSRFDPGSPEAISDPARAVIHQFLIVDGDLNSPPGAQLQALGAQLMWAMHRYGWINTSDANASLRIFNAMPVPRSF